MRGGAAAGGPRHSLPAAAPPAASRRADGGGGGGAESGGGEEGEGGAVAAGGRRTRPRPRRKGAEARVATEAAGEGAALARAAGGGGEERRRADAGRLASVQGGSEAQEGAAVGHGWQGVRQQLRAKSPPSAAARVVGWAPPGGMVSGRFGGGGAGGRAATVAAGSGAGRRLDVREHLPIPARLAVSLGPGVSAAWEVGSGNLVVQEVMAVCTDAGGRVLQASHFTEAWQFTPAGKGRSRGGRRPKGTRFVGNDGRDYFAVGDGGPEGSRTTVWTWAWSLSREGRSLAQLGLVVGGAGVLAGSLPARLGALGAADRREPEVVRRFQFGSGAYSVDVYLRQGRVVGGGRAPAPQRPARVPAVGERWERAREASPAAAPAAVWTTTALKASNAGLPSVRDRRRALEGGVPYALRMDARIRAEGAACAFSEHRRAAASAGAAAPGAAQSLSASAPPWSPARPWRAAAPAAGGGVARAGAVGRAASPSAASDESNSPYDSHADSPDDSSVEIASDTDQYKNEKAGFLPDLRGRGLYRIYGGTEPFLVPYARLASPSSASGSSDHAGVPPLVNSGTTELASTTDTVSMKRTNLIDAIKAGAFGSKATAIVAVTEFQKKSLPHVHILVPAHSNAEADACAHGDHVAAKPSEPEDTRTIAVAAAH